MTITIDRPAGAPAQLTRDVPLTLINDGPAIRELSETIAVFLIAELARQRDGVEPPPIPKFTNVVQ